MAAYAKVGGLRFHVQESRVSCKHNDTQLPSWQGYITFDVNELLNGGRSQIEGLMNITTTFLPCTVEFTGIGPDGRRFSHRADSSVVLTSHSRGSIVNFGPRQETRHNGLVTPFSVYCPANLWPRQAGVTVAYELRAKSIIHFQHRGTGAVEVVQREAVTQVHLTCVSA